MRKNDFAKKKEIYEQVYRKSLTFENLWIAENLSTSYFYNTNRSGKIVMHCLKQ